MTQHSFIALWMGLVSMAFGFALAGCSNPSVGKIEPESEMEISFTFSAADGLSPKTEAAGMVVGSFSEPQEGAPPYVFSLIDGEGGAHNSLFEVDGLNLIFKGDSLTAGTFRVRVRVTDSASRTFEKAEAVPVPLVLADYLSMIPINAGAYITFFGASTDLCAVTVDQDFSMGETEVTQNLWTAVMGNNPSLPNNIDNPAPGETQGLRPVNGVNWFDAITFCNKLSLATGKTPVYSVDGVDFETVTYDQIPSADSGIYAIYRWEGAIADKTANGYRLPTKNEWAWTAMGADAEGPINATGYLKRYAGDPAGSTDGLLLYAWRDENSDSISHEVGLLLPNEAGIKDMSGNLSEWVWDRSSNGPVDIIHTFCGTDYTTPVAKVRGKPAIADRLPRFQTSPLGHFQDWQGMNKGAPW